MEVQRLRDIVEIGYTHSYDIRNEQKQQFDDVNQQKIDQTFSEFDWYSNLLKEEAQNGFRHLPSKQQIKNIESRTNEARNYILDKAGFSEKEFSKYMGIIELKVETIYCPFAKKTPLFNRWLRLRNRKRRINNVQLAQLF